MIMLISHTLTLLFYEHNTTIGHIGDCKYIYLYHKTKFIN